MGDRVKLAIYISKFGIQAIKETEQNKLLVLNLGRQKIIAYTGEKLKFSSTETPP